MCDEFKERVAGNNVLIRHLEGDIAIIISTASYANLYLGTKFDIGELKTALYNLCEENYRSFDENKFENIVANEIYDRILALGREHFPQYQKDNRFVIPSDFMKGILLEYSTSLKATAASIKKELAEQGLLEERRGVYCWNHTIYGKNIIGYTLILKEDTHET